MEASPSCCLSYLSNQKVIEPPFVKNSSQRRLHSVGDQSPFTCMLFSFPSLLLSCMHQPTFFFLAFYQLLRLRACTMVASPYRCSILHIDKANTAMVIPQWKQHASLFLCWVHIQPFLSHILSLPPFFFTLASCFSSRRPVPLQDPVSPYKR